MREFRGALVRFSFDRYRSLSIVFGISRPWSWYEGKRRRIVNRNDADDANYRDGTVDGITLENVRRITDYFFIVCGIDETGFSSNKFTFLVSSTRPKTTLQHAILPVHGLTSQQSPIRIRFVNDAGTLDFQFETRTDSETFSRRCTRWPRNLLASPRSLMSP